MENIRFNEIQISDYNSLKNKQLSLMIIRYLGLFVIIITQLFTGCFENYFLVTLTLLFLVSLYFKDRGITRQLERTNFIFTENVFYDEQQHKQYQEMKYYENKSRKRLNVYILIESYIWLLFSIAILVMKIKYAC